MMKNCQIKELLISHSPTFENIVFMIEETKNLSEIDSPEVVVMLKGFELKLNRHSEDRDVTEMVFSNLSMQPRNNSCANSSNNKKFWKNKVFTLKICRSNSNRLG